MNLGMPVNHIHNQIQIDKIDANNFGTVVERPLCNILFFVCLSVRLDGHQCRTSSCRFCR